MEVEKYNPFVIKPKQKPLPKPKPKLKPKTKLEAKTKPLCL